jgi:hypothetical protein
LSILDPGATWRNDAVIDMVVPDAIPVGTYRVFVAAGTFDEAPVIRLEALDVAP